MNKQTRQQLAVAIVLIASAISVGCSSDDETSSTTAATPEITVVSTAGAELFADDFIDDANGWGVVDDQQFGTADFADGDYVWAFRGSIAHWLPAVLIDQYDAGTLDMLDVQVSAELTIVSGDGVVGVFCRENPDTDADWQWYDFVVRDGYAAIRLADGEGNIEPLVESRELVVPLGAPFTIDASCQTNGAGGADLAMTVTTGTGTQTLLATVDNDPLTNGAPGLSAWTFPLHEQMDIVWHSFTVRATN
ncbi:MAG: hypothetical protein ABL953_14550 [Ilumatobacteraceae bacterium]